MYLPKKTLRKNSCSNRIGYIAETFDGFAVNIGDCKEKQVAYITAMVDQKTKKRDALMNPTR